MPDEPTNSSPHFLPDNLGVFIGTRSQTLVATDVICEGPIAGLVEGPASVYLDNDRAVPLVEAPALHSEGQSLGKIRLTNGSNIAVVQNLTEEAFAVAKTAANGDRWLIVKDVLQGPITITVAEYEGNGLGAARFIKPSITRGNAFYFKDAKTSGGSATTIPNHAFTSTSGDAADDARWYKFKPARLVAKSARQGEDFLRTIPGWIRTLQYNDTSDTDTGVFYPGYAGYMGGGVVPFGDYELYIDKAIHQSGDIVFPNLYGNYGWTFNPTSAPVDYDFDLTVGMVNNAPSLDDSVVTNYRGVQTQFRAGRLDQLPFGNPHAVNGEGNTAITNTTGLSIEHSTGFGGSQAPITLTASASAGFNLTTTQIPEVDVAKITFNYPAIYAMDDEGTEFTTGVFYRVELALKRPGNSSFDEAILLQEDHKHVMKSKSAVSFQIRQNMAEFGDFTDFKFIISRKTSHEGDGYDNIGNRKTDWTNVTSATVQNTTAIIAERLNYPYTAISRVAWHTSDFERAPKRSYHMRGSMIRVPSNYITREENGSVQATYTRNTTTGAVESDYQDWDGSFRDTLVYSNNPAWVFYDILINNRYGLGHFLEKSDIDIYQLYRIGRYCDELVDDGTNRGISEPRFTCNLFLTKQVDAFKVLKDMLTVFRGMLYFIDGQVVPQFDAPSGPVYNFSKANVIDGAFSYEGTGSKTRINQVIVTWNNPDRNYESENLLVEDRNDIVKSGKIISQEASAFGCTSEGQALRYGRWKLWTATNQTELVSFATGLSGSYLRPGDIVNVQDADKAGARFSGRVGSNVETGLTLSHTKATGTTIGTNSLGFDGTDRTNNVVMAGEAILPSSFSQDECLFEYGGTGTGMWIGVREVSSEYKFVLRTGDGGTSTTATDTQTIIGEIPVDEIPEFDGGSHTIAWEIQPDNGEAYLWIDGRLIFELETTDGSNLDSGVWAGSNVGGWGLGNSQSCGNYALTAWSGAVQSDLRIYNSQTTTDKITLDSPVTLNATSTYKLNILFVEPAAFLAQDTATINSVTYNRGDLIEKAYIDSNGDGTYTFQKVDSSVDSINAKATASVADALLLTWSDHYRVEQQTISGNGTNLTNLTTSSPFSAVPQRSHIWTIEETDNSGADTTLSAVPYRLLSVTEEEAGKFALTGVRYYEEKYDAIEKDFITYVADPVSPAVSSTDPVPVPLQVYASNTSNRSRSGRQIQLFWEPPASLAGGTEAHYEHLIGFVIEHNIPEIENPITTKKGARSITLDNVPAGTHKFSVRTLNVLGNRSQAVLAETTLEDVIEADIERFPLGVPVGGTSDVGLKQFGGNIAFTDANFSFKTSSRSELLSLSDTGNGAIRSQDFSDVAAITYTPKDGQSFEQDLHYILFDASDASDRLKLVKFNPGTYTPYWYNAGTGNGTHFSSNLTGTITKAAGSSTVTGSGTSFTTELSVGQVVVETDGTVLGRIVNIASNTSLLLDVGHPDACSGVAFKTINITIDNGKDSIIAAVWKTSSLSGNFDNYNIKPFITIDAGVNTDQGNRNLNPTYYWPMNSVIGGKMVEVIQGASATAAGVAPTVSTDSPVGKSIQNDDGQVLLEAGAVEALEESADGFAYSLWFKSEGNANNAHARILTRDQSELWGIGLDQSAAAYHGDNLQNLRIWRAGTSVTIKTDAVAFNKWQHIGVTYDTTTLRVFLNGTQIHSDTGYDPAAVDGNTLILGKNQAAGNKFNGKLTEVKAFNRYLEEAQIFAEYNNPGGTIAPTSDRDIQQGDTNGSVFKITSDGISLGHTTFASAPFRVDMAGNLNATSATITGAITATSGSISDSVTIGGGTAGDVVTGTDIIGAGSVNQNPNMTLVAPDGRPQGVLSAFGGASIGNISYQDAAKTVLKLHSSTDNTIGAVWPAFRLNPDATYKVLVRWKATAASSTGAYLRMEELDGELPIGKTHISHNSASSEAAVNEDTREVNLWNNAAIGTSYTDQIFDYTPTAGAKWASVLALNWAGMGNAEMHIDLLYIVEDTSVKSQGSVGGWTIDSDAIFAGTKKTTDDFSASAGDITISSTGAIRANKFLLKANGDAEFKGDITGATGTFAGELAAGSLTVDKISGDVTELFPFRLGTGGLSSSISTGTVISLPAPALGISKRQRVTAAFDVLITNSNSTVQNANLFVGIQKLSKGVASVEIGTMTIETVGSVTRFHVSGNKMNLLDVSGSIATSSSASGGHVGLAELFYDSVNDRTYVKPGDGAVSFQNNDTLFYNSDGFLSANTWSTVGGVNEFTIPIKENSNIRVRLPFDITFSNSTTATQFRPIYKFFTNTQGISGSIKSIDGTLENIA
jgi:predicted phage tail protein